MAKNYSFEFPGTKEAFLNFIHQLPHESNGPYYFDDYLIEPSENGIRFGIARGGHSGGYWFIPTITEMGGKTILSGKIQYVDAFTPEKGIKRIFRKMDEVLLLVFLLPITLIVKIFLFFLWIIRKILKRPKPEKVTEEDRLYNLMENHLHCIRK